MGAAQHHGAMSTRPLLSIRKDYRLPSVAVNTARSFLLPQSRTARALVKQIPIDGVWAHRRDPVVPTSALAAPKPSAWCRRYRARRGPAGRADNSLIHLAIDFGAASIAGLSLATIGTGSSGGVRPAGR
jgi:hypothetical protein